MSQQYTAQYTILEDRDPLGYDEQCDRSAREQIGRKLVEHAKFGKHYSFKLERNVCFRVGPHGRETLVSLELEMTEAQDRALEIVQFNSAGMNFRPLVRSAWGELKGRARGWYRRTIGAYAPRNW